jgi:hypothetical protein
LLIKFPKSVLDENDFRLKNVLTAAVAGTDSLLNIVGVYFHCFTALIRGSPKRFLWIAEAYLGKFGQVTTKMAD